MSTIKHIWACNCGEQSECRAEDQSLGAVWECQRCKQVWGCVYPSRGGKAWVHIDDRGVAFHDLLGRNHQYEDAD